MLFIVVSGLSQTPVWGYSWLSEDDTGGCSLCLQSDPITGVEGVWEDLALQPPGHIDLLRPRSLRAEVSRDSD